MNKRKILILGSDSFIGYGLFARLLNHPNLELFGTSRKVSDKANIFLLDYLAQDFAGQVKQLPKVDIVIHCVAITTHSECEAKPELCNLVNVKNTKQIIHTHFSKAHHIFLSTNRVFSGEKAHATVNEVPRPLTEYGKSKLAIEQFLTQHFANFSVVRMTKVVGAEDELFSHLLRECQLGKEVHVFDNLTISPISYTYALNSIEKIILNRYTGIIHLSGCEDISYAQALTKLYCTLGLKNGTIRPIKGLLDKSLLVPCTSLDMSKNPIELQKACSFEDAFSDLINQFKLN